MAKNKPSKRKSRSTSNPLSVPHVPYVDKFWMDYTDEEYRGLNQYNRWSNRRKSRIVFYIVLFVFLGSLAALYIIAKLTALP